MNDVGRGRRRESFTKARGMDRGDQYPDQAECKHCFVRRRIYSVILGGVVLFARPAWPIFLWYWPRSRVTA